MDLRRSRHRRSGRSCQCECPVVIFLPAPAFQVLLDIDVRLILCCIRVRELCGLRRCRSRGHYQLPFTVIFYDESNSLAGLRLTVIRYALCIRGHCLRDLVFVRPLLGELDLPERSSISFRCARDRHLMLGLAFFLGRHRRILRYSCQDELKAVVCRPVSSGERLLDLDLAFRRSRIIRVRDRECIRNVRHCRRQLSASVVFSDLHRDFDRAVLAPAGPLACLCDLVFICLSSTRERICDLPEALLPDLRKVHRISAARRHRRSGRLCTQRERRCLARRPGISRPERFPDLQLRFTRCVSVLFLVYECNTLNWF